MEPRILPRGTRPREGEHACDPEDSGGCSPGPRGKQERAERASTGTLGKRRKEPNVQAAGVCDPERLPHPPPGTLRRMNPNRE